MKKTVNFYEFSRWFEQHRPNNFSRVGLQELFDYLEEYEDSTGESIEFDPIALCCEYTEYDDLDEFKSNYTCEQYQDIEDWDGLEDYTMTIPLGCGMDSKNGCIIQNF
tara:strand:- start:1699 stop:2022 length:324 start_codon:yes stop_codon:yes gene_type:complete